MNILTEMIQNTANKLKTTSIKDVILIIFFSTIMLILLFYCIGKPIIFSYRHFQGTFSPVNIESNLYEIEDLEFYKNGNKCLFVDTKNHRVYSAIFNLKQKKFVSILDITSKIGTHHDSVQLANSNILFINFPNDNKKHNINFKIYDFNTNSIVMEVKSATPFDSYSWNIFRFQDNNFMLLGYNQETKTYKLIEFKNGVLQETTNRHDDRIFYSKTVPLENNNFLLFMGNPKTFAIYNFNTHNDTLQQIDSSAIEDAYKQIKMKFLTEGFKFVPLAGNKFLVINSKFVGVYKCINIISLFQLNGLELQKIYTIKFDNLNFALAYSNIVALGKNKLLIAGGQKGFATFAKPIKAAYKFDVETKKLKKIGDMGFPYTSQNNYCYKIDNKTVLIYNKDNNFEIFKRGILW